MATKKNAFDVLGDMLDSELGAFDEYPWKDVDLTNIVISKQIREVFEDEDNSIADLSDSIEDLGFFQNVVLRPIDGGRYEMVAGERRYRAAKLAGLTHVHAYVRSMTDEQMEKAKSFLAGTIALSPSGMRNTPTEYHTKPRPSAAAKRP